MLFYQSIKTIITYTKKSTVLSANSTVRSLISNNVIMSNKNKRRPLTEPCGTPNCTLSFFIKLINNNTHSDFLNNSLERKICFL